MSFKRLVRFEHDGQVLYGDLLETRDDGFKVAKLGGTLASEFTVNKSESIIVEKVGLSS